MNDQEREEMLDKMQREVFSPENDDPRNVQLREQQAEIERLRGLLAAAYREECCEQVKSQYRQEIERLRAERDEARRAAAEMAFEYSDSCDAADCWLDRYAWLEGEMRKAAVKAGGDDE